MCCQSFKTLEKKARRYKGAVLVNTGFPEAVDELLREDGEKIKKTKTGLRIKEIESSGMFQFQAQPSVVLWFDTMPSEAEDLESLTSNAVDMMLLQDLSRDDIREMLLALLPDRK